MTNMQKVGTVSSASNFEKSAAMSCYHCALCEVQNWAVLLPLFALYLIAFPRYPRTPR